MYTYGFVLMNVDDTQLQIAREFLSWLASHDEYIPAMINGVPTLTSVLDDMKDDTPLYVAYQDAEKYVFDLN